jgi:hypothetical protein
MLVIGWYVVGWAGVWWCSVVLQDGIELGIMIWGETGWLECVAAGGDGGGAVLVCCGPCRVTVWSAVWSGVDGMNCVELWKRCGMWWLWKGRDE